MVAICISVIRIKTFLHVAHLNNILEDCTDLYYPWHLQMLKFYVTFLGPQYFQTM